MKGQVTLLQKRSTSGRMQIAQRGHVFYGERQHIHNEDMLRQLLTHNRKYKLIENSVQTKNMGMEYHDR